MTEQQYARWMRLSVGLARSGFQNITRKRRRRLVSEVSDAVDWIACNGIETIECWDSGPDYVCDRMNTWLYDNGHLHYRCSDDAERRNRFADHVSCCVRAGFDIAVAPSAGVIAFNVGDLERACRGRIPKWVREWFDPPLPLDAPKHEGVWL